MTEAIEFEFGSHATEVVNNEHNFPYGPVLPMNR